MSRKERGKLEVLIYPNSFSIGHVVLISSVGGFRDMSCTMNHKAGATDPWWKRVLGGWFKGQSKPIRIVLSHLDVRLIVRLWEEIQPRLVWKLTDLDITQLTDSAPGASAAKIATNSTSLCMRLIILGMHGREAIYRDLLQGKLSGLDYAQLWRLLGDLGSLTLTSNPVSALGVLKESFEVISKLIATGVEDVRTFVESVQRAEREYDEMHPTPADPELHGDERQEAARAVVRHPEPAAVPRGDERQEAARPVVRHPEPAAVPRGDERRKVARSAVRHPEPATVPRRDERRKAARPVVSHPEPAAATPADPELHGDERQEAARPVVRHPEPAAVPRGDERRKVARPAVRHPEPAAVPRGDERRKVARPVVSHPEPAAVPRGDERRKVARPVVRHPEPAVPLAPSRQVHRNEHQSASSYCTCGSLSAIGIFSVAVVAAGVAIRNVYNP